MATSGTPYQAFTGVGNNAFAVLLGPQGCEGAFRVYGLIGGTGTFDVHIEITSDSGTTWIPLKKTSSAAGPDATYTNAVEIDQYVPSLFRIRLKNTSGGSANFVSDVRFFLLRE